jgi:alkylation response protein AidB-like acyl-CoA dehydrogenase
VLYCYVDRKSDSANLSPSPAMQLAVMTAADTVSVEINELFVPDRFVLQRHAAEQVPQRDLKNITTHVTLPLGCARGSVRYLRTLNFPLAIDGAARLQTEIDEVRECAEYWVGSRADEAGYMKNALKARVRAVTVALRAAETSIAASGGRAHLLTHPAQRRLREAGFYATMALTPDTQAALMEMFIND